MGFHGVQKRSQQRGIRLSRRETAQLVILAVLLVIVVLIAMALGVRTRNLS